MESYDLLVALLNKEPNQDALLKGNPYYFAKETQQTLMAELLEKYAAKKYLLSLK
jgi:hypothetical protein